jgi:hypothetical protein
MQCNEIFGLSATPSTDNPGSGNNLGTLVFSQLRLDPTGTDKVLLPTVLPLVTTIIRGLQGIARKPLDQLADTGMGLLQTEIPTTETYFLLYRYHFSPFSPFITTPGILLSARCMIFNIRYLPRHAKKQPKKIAASLTQRLA